jgi:hypothetical protein
MLRKIMVSAPPRPWTAEGVISLWKAVNGELHHRAQCSIAGERGGRAGAAERMDKFFSFCENFY